jgi:hypothetical protein
MQLKFTRMIQGTSPKLSALFQPVKARVFGPEFMLSMAN